MRNITFLYLILMICFSSCYKETEYLPTNINPDSVIIKLTTLDQNIPADGSSFTYITAELPLTAMDSRSSVVFTTTRGTFDNNTKTITQSAVLINDNGINRRIAKVKLIASAAIETADVTATVSNISKTVKVPFLTPAYDSYLNITNSSGNIPADGTSFVILNVEQPLNIPSDNTTVTFTTSAGSFDNGTKTITKSTAVVLVGSDYKRVAHVKLTATKIVETANIEVGLKSTLKTSSVVFVKAFPESVKLNIGAPSITTGLANSVQITTTIIRSVGIPSIGNDASVTVTDTNNVVRGSFINYNTKSDANGIIVNKFTLGTDTYKGKLNVTATTQDAAGNTQTDKVQIIAQ